MPDTSPVPTLPVCRGPVPFMLSLTWFETLVWIGVRHSRYANAWPKSLSADPVSPAGPQ